MDNAKLFTEYLVHHDYLTSGVMKRNEELVLFKSDNGVVSIVMIQDDYKDLTLTQLQNMYTYGAVTESLNKRKLDFFWDQHKEMRNVFEALMDQLGLSAPVKANVLMAAI